MKCAKKTKCAKNALNLNLSAQEQMIVHYIKENGKSTSSQLAALLGVKKRRAQSILKELVDSGIIYKEGKSRNTCYKV